MTSQLGPAIRQSSSICILLHNPDKMVLFPCPWLQRVRPVLPSDVARSYQDGHPSAAQAERGERHGSTNLSAAQVCKGEGANDQSQKTSQASKTFHPQARNNWRVYLEGFGVVSLGSQNTRTSLESPCFQSLSNLPRNLPGLRRSQQRKSQCWGMLEAV